MANPIFLLLFAVLLLFPSQKEAVRYEVHDIHFKYGSDLVTVENKVEMDSLLQGINRIEGNNFILVAQAGTCIKELKECPNLGLLRAKKVTDYMNPRIIRKDLKLYIHPNYHVEKEDCTRPNYSHYSRVMLVAVRK